jgi:hypothetical protein
MLYLIQKINLKLISILLILILYRKILIIIILLTPKILKKIINVSLIYYSNLITKINIKLSVNLNNYTSKPIKNIYQINKNLNQHPNFIPSKPTKINDICIYFFLIPNTIHY